MSKLIVKTIAHTYSEEEIHDDFLNYYENETKADVPLRYIPLLRCRNNSFELNYKEKITIGDFKDLFFSKICDENTIDFVDEIQFCFITTEKKYYIDNPNNDFSNILCKYLDPNSSGCITVGLFICDEAGLFDKVDNIRFYFHSHEGDRHNEPHVHVYDVGGNFEVSISLLTGEVLTPGWKIPKKALKIARKRIFDNQQLFLEGWNELTDGLSVDINKLLGLSEV